MSNSKSLDHTFKTIRELPLEISLEQVKWWVEKAPPLKLKKTKWSLFKELLPSWNKN